MIIRRGDKKEAFFSLSGKFFNRSHPLRIALLFYYPFRTSLPLFFSVAKGFPF